MTRTIVIASNNKNKVREIADILNECDCTFLTLEEAGITSDPVEDADSFVGNARIKAQSAHGQASGYAVLADDSGLQVDALKGEPGVYSSRYAGPHATDKENNALLLERLSHVEADQRTARFVCSIVFIDEHGNESVAYGSVEGKIGFEERGEHGFGYDPLFFPDEYFGELSFAEIDDAEKNRLSHRFKALNEIRSILFHD